MINSDVDTIIRNDNHYNGNKKSKLKIFLIIFLILIFMAGGALGYFYYAQYKAKLPKIKFFEYVSNTNFNKIGDPYLGQALLDKISNTSCSIKSNLKLASNNELTNISKINMDLNYSKNNENLTKTELSFKNDEEEIIKYTLINDGENIGVKSDDIVIKYIGSKVGNLNNLINRMISTEMIDIDYLKESQIQVPQNSFLDKYKNVINQRLTDEKFSIEENVLLTQNGSSVEATIYELSLTKQEFLQICTELKEQLLNDNELMMCFITGKTAEGQNINNNILKLANGCKMDVTLDQIKQYIEQGYEELYNNFLQLEDLEFKFDIYVSNDKVIKKSINYGDYFEIDLENEIKSENENYAKITIIGQDQNHKKNGISLSVNRLDNNVSTIINSELSIIENMEINKKLTMAMTLEGNENSASLNNKLVLTFTNTSIQVSVNMDSKIEFGANEEIEGLNSENCLFLDELDNQTLVSITEQVSQRMSEVLKEKIEQLNQEKIETPSDSSILNMDNIANNIMQNSDETRLKEEAKEKLIKEISNAMTEAQNENIEYALTDLQNLQIEGSTLSVMVGENMAVIALDGYTFYLDPNFVLTTE